MGKIVPNRQELIDLLDDLLNKYPPTYLPNVTNLLLEISDNTKRAYQKLIDEYPELLLFESFCRIYLPQKTAAQIADKILSPEILNAKKKKEPNSQRRMERGFSPSNKILAEAEAIISHPDEIIKKYKCKISKIEFHSLLIIAHRLREKGKSIDRYFNKQQYADDIRELIAYSLYIIYEMGIMFRGELYTAYENRTKTIKKMPETEVYYQDAQKLKVTRKGKQTIKETIEKDADEYRKYLMRSFRHASESSRDRLFYEEKKFRYMTVLIARLNELFREDVKVPKNTPSPLRDKRKNNSRFFIDSYINEAINKPRPIYGILLIDVPAIEASIKVDCTKD